jgi:membrane associated rhomboid family serine protease
MTLIALLALAGAIYYFTTPQEQARFARAASAAVRQGFDIAVRLRPKPGAFDDALRERGAWLVTTPVLAALNIGIFVCMLFAPGALSDPETLIRWGASFGPRTTNGEWWRLVTSLFVHASFLQLFVNVAALVQIGSIMERLYGRTAFASAYLSAGLASSIVTLSMHPTTVAAGGTGSVYGVVGLLMTWLAAGLLFRSSLTIPLKTALLASPGVGIFLLYSMAAGLKGPAEMTGLAVGVVCGLVLAKDAHARKPPLLRVAATMGAVVLVAIPTTVPLRGLTDVRPELAQVAAVEQRTATAYNSAVRRFTTGEIPVSELTTLIERTIVPDLQAAHARVNKLTHIPPEHDALVAAARRYFQLREKSWRIRADALRKINRATLRQADDTEDAALRVLGEAGGSEQPQ